EYGGGLALRPAHVEHGLAVQPGDSHLPVTHGKRNEIARAFAGAAPDSFDKRRLGESFLEIQQHFAVSGLLSMVILAWPGRATRGSVGIATRQQGNKSIYRSESKTSRIVPHVSKTETLFYGNERAILVQRALEIELLPQAV